MIEIKLTDVPEFDKQLKITITLEKDGEGIRESVTTTPVPPPSLESPVVNPEVVQPLLETKTKRTTKKKTTEKEERKVDTGDGSTLSTCNSNPQPPKKFSGNMMNLDF